MKFTPIPQSGTTAYMVAGSVIGAIAGGVPGAIVGGIIGSIIDEIRLCPICKSAMNPIDAERKNWRCSKCGHFERKQ